MDIYRYIDRSIGVWDGHAVSTGDILQKLTVAFGIRSSSGFILGPCLIFSPDSGNKNGNARSAAPGS